MVLQEKRRLDEAIACIRKSLDLKPDYRFEAFHNLGDLVKEKIGRLDEAIAFIRKGLDLKPDDPNAHLGLAAALLARGNRARDGRIRMALEDPTYNSLLTPATIVLLARTKNTRLITGAVLPAFNSPLKLAGEIGMLDGISAGRLEVGFARAFLPHQFAQFGISLDESRRRFTEGLAQITMLLKGESVSSQGEFHSFKNVTSLPRPPATASAALDRRDGNTGKLRVRRHDGMPHHGHPA